MSSDGPCSFPATQAAVSAQPGFGQAPERVMVPLSLRSLEDRTIRDIEEIPLNCEALRTGSFTQEKEFLE